jgi:CRISPR-associated protein Csd2
MNDHPITSRYDFVYMFDVQDGNPNGDPDAGSLPRMDSETGCGLVTDVCLKRKVRNYVTLAKGDKPPFEIYVKEKAILNRQHERAYAGIGVKFEPKENERPWKSGETVDVARAWMCRNFYDVRTFGAVMSTGVNCGQVRGPVQLTFARSIDPILLTEHSITKMAVVSEAEAEKQDGGNRSMGRKSTIPYGLYLSHGFISAHLADQSGFNTEDLSLLWESLSNMFEHDRAAARGMMAARKLFIFKHDSALGNAPSNKLFDLITVMCKDKSKPARSFADYEVIVNREGLPKGVILEEKI